MLKVIPIVYLCVCVMLINCSELKCDIKTVIDLKTKNKVVKNEFCKNKNCVYKICDWDMMLILFKNTNIARCRSTKEIEKITNISLSIPMFKRDDSNNVILSDKTISRLDFVFVNFPRLEKQTNKTCRETRKSAYPAADNGFLEDGSFVAGKDRYVEPPLGFIVEFQISQSNDSQWRGPDIIFKKLLEEIDRAQDIYDAVAELVSCFFLVLVLIVYSLLEGRRTYYEQLLMAYVACFAISFAQNAALTLSLNAGLICKSFCKYIMAVKCFSVLSTYTWLNLLAYEIWNAFRVKNMFKSNSHSKSSGQANYTKLLKATVYAFGMPLLATTILYVIDNLELTNVRPNFQNCMHSDSAQLFLYVPMMALLFVNLVFYLMTAYRLWLCKKNENLSSSESRTTKKNQINFCLYLKLTISTGVVWLLDLVAVFVDLPVYLEYCIDFSILFLGVIIFITCVCNEKVLRQLRKRFSSDRGIRNQSSGPYRQTWNTKMSSCS